MILLTKRLFKLTLPKRAEIETKKDNAEKQTFLNISTA